MANRSSGETIETNGDKVASAIEYAFLSLNGAWLRTSGSRSLAVLWEVESVTNEFYEPPVVHGPTISVRAKRGTGPWDPYKFYNAKKAGLLIDRARDGDPIAMDATWEIAANFIDEGYVLPEGLRQYIVDLLLGDATCAPAKSRGRAGYVNYERDFKIASVIRQVVDRGFKPTRNHATESESACSIVNKALKRLGLHLSEAAVVKIWEKFGPTF
jgi:hypothetical protein